MSNIEFTVHIANSKHASPFLFIYHRKRCQPGVQARNLSYLLSLCPTPTNLFTKCSLHVSNISGMARDDHPFRWSAATPIFFPASSFLSTTRTIYLPLKIRPNYAIPCLKTSTLHCPQEEIQLPLLDIKDCPLSVPT